MFKSMVSAVLAAGLLAAPAAEAALIRFDVPLSGAQEVAPGDPDGSGSATLWFDDLAFTVSWSITVANIALPVAAAHIHQAPAGVNGPVRVDFSGQLNGGPLFDADIAAILANPTGWYVNVHNAAFPGGAVRGQLPREFAVVPEPAALGLGLLGLLGLGLNRRRCRA